jgi:hypothetical protein
MLLNFIHNKNLMTCFYSDVPIKKSGNNRKNFLLEFVFVRFPNLFAIWVHKFKYNQQIVCWEARAGRGVLCRPLRDKIVKTLCGCREKVNKLRKMQTKTCN